MPNAIYDLRDCKKENKYEASLQHLHRTLDSLGNNLITMLLLMKLSLDALGAMKSINNLDQAKRDLKNALQVGNNAMKLMRAVLDAQTVNHLDG